MRTTAIDKPATSRVRKNSYCYTIQSEAERKEVEWLISEGDIPSIEHYEKTMTQIINGKKKPVN